MRTTLGTVGIAFVVLAGHARADYEIQLRTTTAQIDPAHPIAIVEVWSRHTRGRDGGSNFGTSGLGDALFSATAGLFQGVGVGNAPFQVSTDPFFLPENHGDRIENLYEYRPPLPPQTPMPAPAVGVHDFVMVYQIPLIITDFADQEVVISGTSEGRRIASWVLFAGAWHPSPSGPGVINPVQIATAELRIPIVPSPGVTAPAILGLGILAPRRRRRS